MPQIVRLAQHCQDKDKDKDNLLNVKTASLAHHKGPIFGLVLNDIMVTSTIVNNHHRHGDHCKWLSWSWWSLWMVLAIIVNDYHGQYDLMFRIIFLSTLVAGKTLVWRFNLFNPGKKISICLAFLFALFFLFSFVFCLIFLFVWYFNFFNPGKYFSICLAFFICLGSLFFFLCFLSFYLSSTSGCSILVKMIQGTN